jgi:putative ABC transport system substrate-binding protein
LLQGHRGGVTFDGRRRILGGLLPSLVAPLAAAAQPAGKVYRIGVLLPLGTTPPILGRFLIGMRERGWVHNQSFVVEPRYAEGRLERLPELAAALVRLHVDVLVTMGTPATIAAKHATASIPIVFALVGDAVGADVVPSLARPGGNLTGMSLYSPEVFGEGLALLKEAVPGAKRIMITRPPHQNPSQALADATADTVAQVLRIQLRRVDVSHVADYEAAFEVAVKEQADAVLVSPYTLAEEDGRFCPAASAADDDADGITLEPVGQLIAYGANFGEQVCAWRTTWIGF